MSKTIELSKIVDDVVLIDGNGKGMEKEEFVEQIEDGWLGYYLVCPISNSIVEQVAVVTERHSDYCNDALSEALECFENYRNERFTEDELAMLSFQEIVTDSNSRKETPILQLQNYI